MNKNKKLNESSKVFLDHIAEAGKKGAEAGAKCREAAERLSVTMQKLICPTDEGRKALKLNGLNKEEKNIKFNFIANSTDNDVYNDIEELKFICKKCKKENTEFVYSLNKTCKCGGEIEAIVLLTGKIRKIEISGEIIL